MFKSAHIVHATLLLSTLTGCSASRPADSAQQTANHNTQSTLTRPVQASAQTAQSAAQAAPGKAAGPIGNTALNTSSTRVGSAQAAPEKNGEPEPTVSNGLPATTVQAFASTVQQKHGVPPQYTRQLLSEARLSNKVRQLMAPPKTRIKRSWTTYRNRFVEPVRIDAGLEFWKEHQQLLDETAAQYGVPASIIVAIIGVETIYGRYMGNFRVLDALATLAFQYPAPERTDRVELFRDQLADLVALDYQGLVNARSQTGSYAGAFGLPQFMPGSLMRYAVDGDGNGHIDLENSPADAIASVANFLRQHGWQPGLPVFAPVTLSAQAASLVNGGLDPTLSWEDIKNSGAQEHNANGADTWKREKLGVIDLVDESRQQAEYRAGTANFFAITQYNRSYFYATSVAELAEALARQIGYH